MTILLGAFQNIVDQSSMCVGLTVTGILIGVYGDFTKFCCFLCLCDSRPTAEHFVKRDWEPRRFKRRTKTASNTFLSLIQ
jgi:hypothetical protein